MADKSPPPCWIDKKLKELKPEEKTNPEQRKRIYGIWRKYNQSTKKKIVEECGKKGKKAINKKK